MFLVDERDIIVTKTVSSNLRDFFYFLGIRACICACVLVPGAWQCLLSVPRFQRVVVYHAETLWRTKRQRRRRRMTHQKSICMSIEEHEQNNFNHLQRTWNYCRSFHQTRQSPPQHCRYRKQTLLPTLHCQHPAICSPNLELYYFPNNFKYIYIIVCEYKSNYIIFDGTME